MRRRKSRGRTLESSYRSPARWNRCGNSPPRLWLEALEDRRMLADPSISDIADQVTNEDTATAAIAFTIGGDGTLTLAGGSSNTTLVPINNIVFGGAGADRTVTITPAANRFGTSTISVTVDNGGGSPATDTFLLTVNAVNDAPAAAADRYFVAEDRSLSTAANVLVPLGSAWRYLDNGSDQGTAWRDPGFNDASWQSGPAQLGYGEGDEATVVSFGSDPNNKYATTYFRTSFNLPDTAGITGLHLRLRRDDGIAVYLNGTEIVRDNLAAGAAFNTFALGNAGDDGQTLLDFNVPATALQSGTNVLAVEIHQSGGTSSDISFDLGMTSISTQTLLPMGSTWKYLDNGSDQGAAWQHPSFSDAAWASGPAQLGYGDGDESTVVGYGGDTNNKYVTTYFRTTFNVADAANLASAQIRLKRDDGIAVYLNGVEIIRDNLAAGAAFNTFAGGVAGDDGTAILTFTVPAGLLVEGANVLAAEIHQASATSSDISFDLDVTATRILSGVLANDTDVEANPLTAVLDRGPSHGTLNLAANGSFTYTPNANFHGTDSFAYHANDGSANSNIATVAIRVLSANDSATTADDSYSATQDNPLVVSATADVPIELLPAGSVWAYLDNGSNQGTGWRAAAVNDSGWVRGPAQLGYGDGDEMTTVGFGPDANNKYVTTYFRTTFDVRDPASISALALHLLRDDGAAVYLNGTEVVRTANLAPSAAFDTLADFNGSAAVGGADESTFFDFTGINLSLLVEGTNVLAVEIHQFARNSSDISFDMQVTATRHRGGVLVNDGDIDGDSITATITAPPTHGNASLNADGTFSYTPGSGFYGTDTFTYVAHEKAQLVSAGSQWSYLDNGSDQGTAWRQAAFNDSAWARGLAQLGYGEADEATVVSFGPDANNKRATTYFRHAFSVSNPAQVESLTLRLLRDDGAAVYLNRTEVARTNLNAAAPFNEFANAQAADDGQIYQVFTVSPALLIDGMNVLAVEIHQVNGTSSDISFDLELKGTVVSAPTLVTIDVAAVGLSVTNTLDSGDGSLRQAIKDANDDPGHPHTINFMIPGAAPHVIGLDSNLPPIADPVSLNVTVDDIVKVGTGLSFTFGEYADLAKIGAGTLTIGGAQSHGSAATIHAIAGVLNLNSDGGDQLTVEANATVRFGSTQHIAALHVGPSGTATLTAGGGKVLVTTDLVVNGTLDLANNVLVVRSTLAARAAVLNDVFAKLASGFAGGLWNGSGINSSAAAADGRHVTALGVLLNDSGGGLPYYSTFSGVAVDVNCILVKYTLYGDTELNGVINAVDYARLDNGFSSNLTGWINGDFDYTGSINGNDYAYIDNAFNSQPTGLNVTNTDDSGTGSLRQAIKDANDDPGHPHTINFMISGVATHAIHLDSNLPSIADPVSLNTTAADIIEVGTLSSFTFGEYADLAKIGTGTLTIGGDQSHDSAATIHAAGGVLNLDSDGGERLTVEATAAVNFGATQHLAALHVGDDGTAALTTGGGKVLVTNDLVVNGTLDLADNDLVVQATTETRAALLDHVLAKLTSGFAAGGSNGTGINSTAAAADAGHLTALGVMLNEFFEGFPYYFEFSGVEVDTNSILVKYTFYGDSDLSGVVDGSDYAAIDNGFNFGLSGWINGDFDYSSSIDGNDYAYIDNAFNFQSGTLSGGAPQAAQLMDLSGGQQTPAPTPAATGSSSLSEDSDQHARSAPTGTLPPLDGSTAQAIALAIHSSATRDTLDDDLLNLLSGRVG